MFYIRKSSCFVSLQNITVKTHFVQQLTPNIKAVTSNRSFIDGVPFIGRADECMPGKVEEEEEQGEEGDVQDDQAGWPSCKSQFLNT